MRNKKGQFIKGHKERIGIKHTQEVKDKIKKTKTNSNRDYWIKYFYEKFN